MNQTSARLLGDRTIAAGQVLVLVGGWTAEATLNVDGGTFTNNGTIEIRGGYYAFSGQGLHFLGDAVLTGTGQIDLTTGYGNTGPRRNSARLTGEPGVTVTVEAGQQIHGIGSVQVNLINHGVIVADVAGQALNVGGTVNNQGTLQAVDGGSLMLGTAVDNQGTLRAANGGILVFSGATVANAGQTIAADGGVVLISNSTINGGTLLATDIAASAVRFSGDATLNGMAWEDPGAGEFQVDGTTARLLGDRLIPAGQTLLLHSEWAVTAQLRLSGGEFRNQGRIVLAPSLSWKGCSLYLEADTTLTGSGEVVLADASDAVAEIDGATGVTLTVSATQTLHGVGQIAVAVVNQGTIVVEQSGAILTLGTAVDNQGTLRAANGGILVFSGATVANAGQTIAADGGVVLISNSTINGGTLLATDIAASAVRFSGDATLNGVAWEDPGAGEFQVDGTTARLLGDRLIPAGQTLLLHSEWAVTAQLRLSGGEFRNQGRIVLAPSLSWKGCSLYLEADTTLTGSGEVVLADASDAVAEIDGATGVTLTVSATQTLHGVGQIAVAVVNQGTIVVEQSGAILTLGTAVDNQGTLRAANGGILVFSGATVANAGQTIAADGGVVLISNSTINGGTLLATDIAASAVRFSGDATLNGVAWEDPGAGEFQVHGTTVRLLGDRLIPRGQTLLVQSYGWGMGQLRFSGGEFTNQGRIVLAPAASNCPSWLYLEGDTTLTGSGEVVLADASDAVAELDGAAGVTLTVSAAQTLHGTGQIGVAVVNQGTIAADQGGISLTLGAAVENQGTLRATNGGILIFSGATVANAGRMITADSGAVQISDSTINGGTLLSTDNGASAVRFSGDVTLNGVTWEDPGAGEFQVYGTTARLLGDKLIPAGQTLLLRSDWRGMAQLRFSGGEFTNRGRIALAPGNGWSWPSCLYLEGDTTLTGSGEVVLADSQVLEIDGATGVTLTVSAAQTLHGTGQIGVAVVNQGTIAADQGGISLTLGAAVENQGTLRATNGGILIFSGATVANAGRTITADGGAVQISDSTINGGTLLSTDNGASAVRFSGDGTLNGVTWEDPGAGEFQVYGTTARLLGDKLIPAGQTLLLYGKWWGVAQLRFAGGEFTNQGRIVLAPDQWSLSSSLYFEGDTTLTETGRWCWRIRGTRRSPAPPG